MFYGQKVGWDCWMMDSLTLPELDPVFAESSSHYHHTNNFLPSQSSLQMMMRPIWACPGIMLGWLWLQDRPQASYDTRARCPLSSLSTDHPPVMSGRPRVTRLPPDGSCDHWTSCHPLGSDQADGPRPGDSDGQLTRCDVSSTEAGAGLRTRVARESRAQQPSWEGIITQLRHRRSGEETRGASRPGLASSWWPRMRSEDTSWLATRGWSHSLETGERVWRLGIRRNTEAFRPSNIKLFLSLFRLFQTVNW